MLDRVGLYSLKFIPGCLWGILWKESLQKQHELIFPIRVNYVEPGKITEVI
jgi:hypothetical protein